MSRLDVQDGNGVRRLCAMRNPAALLAALALPFSLNAVSPAASQAAGTKAGTSQAGDSPRLRAFAGTSPLSSSLPATPEVTLESDPPEVFGVESPAPQLKAITADIPTEGAVYLFESEQAEPESGEPEWQLITESTTPNAEVPGLANGLYNFRVRVKVEGKQYEAELPDRLVAIGAPPVVRLTRLSSEVRGTITLQTKVTEAAGVTITGVTFEWEPTGSRPGNAAWQKIGSPIAIDPKHLRAETSFDTTGVPDGDYSFRVVPEYEPEENGAAVNWPSIPQRGVLVDNTPPTVQLINPGTTLTEPVAIYAKAGDPAPVAGEPSSGISTVRFQTRAETATGTWTTFGTATHDGEASSQFPVATETYAQALNVAALANGPYEFRAIAEDRDGNVTASQPVRGITIAHAAVSPAVSATLGGVTAPAREVRFLGTIPAAEGREAETWAYGFTSAAPAAVGGHRLEYTAEGQQLVLLRYTASEGWQIREVLEQEQPDKTLTAFKLLKPGEVNEVSGQNDLKVAGAMTPSGEGWLWLAEPAKSGPQVVGLFHRGAGAGRPFIYDKVATEALQPLLGFSPHPLSVRLGESADGHAYGMLTAPGQAEHGEEEPAGSGELVREQIKYGLLENGRWTLQTAALPQELQKTARPVVLSIGDMSAPGEGWALFEATGEEEQLGRGLILGRLKDGGWKFAPTGNPALDLTGADADPLGAVRPLAIKAHGGEVWVEAKVKLPPEQNEQRPVVALIEEAPGEGYALKTARSWCSLGGSPAVEWTSCEEPLGHAVVPDAIFEPEQGGSRETVALALDDDETGSFVDVFEHGEWRGVLAPGYGYPEAAPSEADFSGPDEGWLAGANALGAWSAATATSSLASWPLPDRAPLTSVAVPPGGQATATESGALAVGFKGTALSYDPSLGWQITPVPAREHRVNLLSVAFAAPTIAFAVGQFGTILTWNGSSWYEDPQSAVLTPSQLDAVAFATGESEPGEGYAVGAGGTILHFDGRSWASEEPPSEDADVNITSVAVAGEEAFAIAGGELITHRRGQPWEPALCGLRSGSAAARECAAKPCPEACPERWNGGAEPPSESLRQVAALPDGGVVLAGRSVELFREAAGEPFKEAPQPLQGIAVALAPYRDANGKLRTYVSTAPGADAGNGSPVGDGELLRESENGWQDLSRTQYAGSSVEGDGAVKSDPVLALATGSSGEHLWAVGGYDGTPDAAGQGTEEPVGSRPESWQTASLWHYDTGSTEPPPATAATEAPALTATPGTVAFAFFTSPLCKERCSAVAEAQPDVNLRGAAREIAAYAGQEGGPAFAMLGGNAVGPVEASAFEAGTNAVQDFSHLSEQLAPLGDLPTFAAAGAFDHVPGQPGNDALRPWAEAFAGAPPPFGAGPSAGAITPAAPAGAAEDEVHRYYGFNVNEDGGSLRVIVLDDSTGVLDGAQRGWLESQLYGAGAEGLPVVVVSATPLRNNTTGANLEWVAELLTEPRWNGEVLATFSTDGSVPRPTNPGEQHEYNERHMIPAERAKREEEEQEQKGEHEESPTIPEYEGATLGYQQSANNGVEWYLASVDTVARTVKVSAVPVIESLALKAVDGLVGSRGKSLQFEAVARRPPATLATKATELSQAFEGFDTYVDIPAPGCSGGRPCVHPSYRFSSSSPTVAQFVASTALGSPFPTIDPTNDRAIASSTSGLLCAYNPGTTVVTITAALLSYSETVTVPPGPVSAECGKEPLGSKSSKNKKKQSITQAKAGPAGAPAAPPTALSGVNPTLTVIPPAPAPAPLVKSTPPPPPAEQFSVPTEQVPITPALVPATTPPVEPIPPGSGGYAQSPSAAERREKARKHASQSAFVIRPAGTSGQDWFYGAVAISMMLVLALTAGGIRGGSRGRPAPAFNRTPAERERRRGR